MRNLCLIISYNGSNYHGFQVQKNSVTVCEIFQTILESIVNEKVNIKGCSRTDSGVHANNYTLSFYTSSMINENSLVRALNCRLPDDIAVKSCTVKGDDFHARYSCIGKKYVYKILNSQVKNPCMQKMVFQYPYALNEKMLNIAAKAFIGEHDFCGFCSIKNDTEDTKRTIYAADVTRQGDMVYFTFSGNGFLYNMVRIMSGTLFKIAEGKILPDDLHEIINSKNRKKSGPTAPAHGLYLEEVFYS